LHAHHVRACVPAALILHWLNCLADSALDRRKACVALNRSAAETFSCDLWCQKFQFRETLVELHACHFDQRANQNLEKHRAVKRQGDTTRSLLERSRTWCVMNRSRIKVKVVGADVTCRDNKTYINPPKTAKEILERLQASGYVGDLQSYAGASLSGDDLLDDKQEYTLELAPEGNTLCL